MKSSLVRKNLGPFPTSSVASLFLILLLASFSAEASRTTKTFDPSSVTWKLHLQQGSTKIYHAAPLDSGLIPLKASTVFNHSLKKVYHVLYDNTRKIEWVPRLKESHLVKKFQKGEYITYSRYNSPWPFADRSALVKIVDSYNPQSKSLHSFVVSTDYSSLPPKSDEVRIYTKGFITLKELDGGKKCSAEMILINDFKGNIPIWLINFVQKNWPAKMFTRLKKQLKKNDIKLLSDLII